MRGGGRGEEEVVAVESLGEQLLEEALLLGLVVLGALRHGTLLGGGRPDGALVQVGVTADEVHCALDVGKHLNLLHLTETEADVSEDKLLAGVSAPEEESESLTCWSVHTEPTLLRLLLLKPTGCPMGGKEPTPPEPPAMDTVMLMLL